MVVETECTGEWNKKAEEARHTITDCILFFVCVIFRCFHFYYADCAGAEDDPKH